MAKETYPLPGAGRKPKPPLHLINTGGTSENDFWGTRQEWEERIFRNANHFTVVRFGVPNGSESTTVKTFAEAYYVAHQEPRALIYAVTLSGRAFCVPASEYVKYAEIHLSLKKQS